LDQNPEVIAAIKSTDAARENIALKRSGHMPTLDLVASASTRDTNADIYSSDFDDASIGVELTLPVFSGGGTSAQTRQARHDFSTAAEQQEKVRRAVRREVRDAYRGVDASISKVKALEAATRSAASSLKATRAGFDVGTRTLVDVLDEQRNLLSAQRDLALERYNYLLNGLRLKKAAGILSVDDLRMVNALLTRR
jgi:outer membrane protein